MEDLAARMEADLVEPGGPSAVAEPPRTLRRRRRSAVAAMVVALAFGAGAGTGMAAADDGTELEAAHAQSERARAAVNSVAARLAEVRRENTTLAASLEDAEASAQAADQKAATEERRLDARAAELDERETQLDTREAELDEQESSLGATEGSSSSPLVVDSSSEFDRAWAVDIASDIVSDVKTVDQRLGDGIAVQSAMFLLSGDFPRLLDAGVPPGVNEARYVARLQTLESFTDEAADLYSSDSTEGSARYAVVREQTGVLLGQLNAAIGSDFRLP